MIDGIKKKFLKILPGYAWMYAAVALAMNILTYCGTRPFTDYLKHYSFYTALDDRIPFRPEWITVYLLAFAFWIYGYYLILREDRQIAKLFVLAEVLAKLICLLCFVAFPTTIERPEIMEADNIFLGITAIVYKIDAPTNLFPSIHCLESWVCFRGAMQLKTVPKWYKYVALVCCMAICASTVLVKQHVVADFFGAVIIFECCLLLAKLYLRRRENTMHE